LFEGTGNVLQESANLFWNATNNRLGINTSTPASALQVVGTLNATNIQSPFIFTTGSDQLILATQGGTAAVTIFPTSRNVLIQSGGTAVDAGFRLDVNGTARVVNNGAAHTTLSNTAGTRTVVWNATANMDMTLSHGSIYLVGNPSFGFLQVGSNKITSTQITGFNGSIINTDGDAFYLHSRPATASTFKLFTGSNGSATANKGTLLITDYANFAITPEQSAQLQVESTVKGFLPPRMTTTQKNAIASPAAGLVVYDTTLGKLCVRTASSWETITSL
jgi:hypothetical protein